MGNKKTSIIIASSVLFSYGVILLLIKYPASYTSGSPVALFWSGVPTISLGKSLLFLTSALIFSYFLTNVKLELDRRYVPVLLFASAFVISMLLWNMPEVNNDYAYYFDLARTIEINGFSQAYQLGTTYFVMPVLDGYLFKLFGEERIIIQILRTALFALTIVVTYHIGKELWNEKVGLVAGALLLSFPYFLTKSHLMLIDVPLAFFITLSVFAVIKAHKNMKWWAIAIVAVFLTLFTKKTGVVHLGYIMPAVLLVLFAKYRWKILKITMPILIVAGFIVLTNFSGFIEGNLQIVLYGQSVAYTSHGIFWLNPQYFLKSLPIVIGPVAAILAFCSPVLLLKKRDYNLLIPIIWMIFPLFLMVNPAFRHLIPAYPAYALAAAVVLVELEKGISIGKISLKLDEKNWKFLFSSAVLLCIFMALFVFPQIEATHEDMNVKEAGEYIDQMELNEIAVLQIKNENFVFIGDNKNAANMLDYYTKAKVTYYQNADPLKKQSSVPEAIVVVTETPMSDMPEDLDIYLKDYYLSKIFSKGDYGGFSPIIFRVYLPQIEYHSRYPEFMQKIGKGMKTEVWEVANPNAGLLNFITWTPSDRKILDKNVNVTWTIEAGDEPMEVGFYYRKSDGFFADKEGMEKIPEGSTVEITRMIEPSQTMGTFIRAVPFEANGKEIKIINVTFRSEFYNTSVSRDMKRFKF